MRNQEIDQAWEYHNRTKHSYESIRRGVRSLDWDNQPLPFKIYSNLPPIFLPPPAERPDAEPLGLKQLAHLLHFSAGITQRRRGEILFRAAACTGALYEIELYLVCGPLPDLPAGLYHFNPGDMGLRRLREGDFRSLLAAATAGEHSLVHAPVIVISAGTYWRNAWKYQARTYRHFGWDNGTILANLLEVAEALGLPASLVCGFVDAEINHLLGLDTEREVSLSLASIGHTESPVPPAPDEIPSLHLKTVPLSKLEVDYPAMQQMHAASSLSTPEEVAAWRSSAEPLRSRDRQGAAPLPEPIEQVIQRRGSSRQFAREPISFAQLSTILEYATRPIPADFLTPDDARLNDLYLIVNAVEGLEPGAYFYRAADRALEPLKHGDFRSRAAYLALEQDLAGDAAVAVFFLADLNRWLGRLGNRGYRAVQLEAGILGGRIYLAAYAQQLGATGLTFYDDDVVQFFSPHAAGKSAVFLVAAGHPARRPS